MTADEVIDGFLADREIEFERVDPTTWLFRLEGTAGAWFTSITVVPENDQVIVHGELPVEVAPAQRAELAEWSARANRGLPVGNFEVDLESGGVWCKTSIDVEDAELTDALLHNLVATNHALVDRYGPGLHAWLSGELPGPDVAVMVAEGYDPDEG